MCCKRNIEIPLWFIPTDIDGTLKARENIYNLGNFPSLYASNKLL